MTGLDGPRRAWNGGIVVLIMVGFGAAWLGELWLVSLSPPVDNIEQLVWVRAVDWGYDKHPPLPTWLMWLAVRTFGLSPGTSYALGATVTLAAVAIFWRLLSDIRGAAYATVASLAGLCITYYNDRLFYYNHNTVLLLASAVAATLAWRAFERGLLRWWLSLGLAIGLAFLCKYQASVLAASLLVFACNRRIWRRTAQLRGLLAAILVAVIVFVPHAYWLREHDFGPVRYALGSSLGSAIAPASRVVASAHWLLDQLLNRLLPALLLLGAVALNVRRRRSPPVAEAAAHSDSRPAPDRAFLLALGGVPLILIPAIGLAFGAELQLQWGTPHLLFAVPAAMELSGRAWELVDRRRALVMFFLIQGVLLGINFVTSPRGKTGLRDRHWTTFDSVGMAGLIAPEARRALRGPIRVVSGNIAIAGALSLRLPERPLVLVDGRYDKSPWVTPEIVRRFGLLDIGSGSTIPTGRPLGPAFPGLSWQVIPPADNLQPRAEAGDGAAVEFREPR